ncbi:hypothetical protein CGLAU_09240 [Corynebacterium glaucum]|uniref:EcsC protein family protein n=1 Tax=Corynebacterium glaucum TaxID=187491 RepID=A0A1Q2HYA0_9CORY|nr:hypothetical protein [Corynebacterium glaucum]AQQ15799.1 hypothetical protein CGLAU_09240 [Corynebacterium glaucum]
MSASNDESTAGDHRDSISDDGNSEKKLRLPFKRSRAENEILANAHDKTEFATTVSEQNGNSEEIAVAFLKQLLRLRAAAVDREQFLRSQLKERGVGAELIDRAIATDVITAGIDKEILEAIARSSINFEVNRSSAISFVSGVGGAATMALAIPGDLAQYYGHAFRIMQKLAYLNGWRSLVDDVDEVTDELLGQFAVFRGVMLGVGGASNALRSFIAQTAAPQIGKSVANKALMKTVWYPFTKKVLQQVGIKITKDTAGKAVTRAVPVVGGVITSGMTYASLKQQSNRLQKTLREIPAPGTEEQK